uniref:Uncharacterized protein n=1 Tax=Oryza nivara TaxID=4536 RepID=A0A0E0IH92_ORYNI
MVKLYYYYFTQFFKKFSRLKVNFSKSNFFCSLGKSRKKRINIFCHYYFKTNNMWHSHGGPKFGRLPKSRARCAPLR